MLRHFLRLLPLLSLLWLVACGGSSDPTGDAGPDPDGLAADLDAAPLDDTTDTGPDATADAADSAPQDTDSQSDTAEVPVETVASVPILPPPEAPFIISHPLIFDGRLYLHTSGTPGTIAPQYLSAYDLRDDNKLLWATRLTDSAFFAFHGAGGTSNLLRSDHLIPVVFLDAAGDQRLVEVHAVTGAIQVDRPVQQEWNFTDAKGIQRTWGVIDPQGAVAEHGDELFFAQGTAIDKCGGAVNWSNGTWKLFGREAVVVRDTAIGFDSGGSLRVKALDLAIAQTALMGYASKDDAKLFETDSGNHLGDTNTTDHLVIWRGLILKGRHYPEAEGDIPQGSVFLEAFSATDGSFGFRMPLDLSALPDHAALADWGSPLVLGHPAVADGILLLPLQTLGDHGFGRALVAFDLEARAQLWATPYTGDWSQFVPTAQSVFVVETTKNEVDDYTGFTVLELDLQTGAPLRRLDAPEAHDGGRLMPVLTAAGDDGTLFELAPLHFEGNLYLTCHSQTGSGSTVAVIPTGDTTANVLQYKYNNQLNPVLNLASPDSNQALDPIPPEARDPEDSAASNGLDFAPVGDQDDSLDTPAAPTPDAAILTSLGLTTEALAALPRTYLALLTEAAFSNSGEDSTSNIGEGYFKVRSKFGCAKANLRYPLSGFLTLHYDPPTPLNGMVAGPDFRTWRPDLPVFYSPLPYMDGSNSALYFTYSALEDDDSDGFELVLLYLGKALSIMSAYLSGDYCAIAQVVTSTIAAEANNYTQHFGAPFLTLYQGGAATVPHFYGIPLDTSAQAFSVQGSASRDPLVAAADAVGSACAISDLASGDFSALEDVMASTLDLFSPDDDSTRGTFTVRYATPLRAKSLKVVLNRLDLEGPSIGINLNTRVAVLGEDPLTAAPSHPASVAGTPFRSLVTWGYQDLTAGAALDLELYDATFSSTDDSPGTAAFYVELVVDNRLLAFQHGNAVHSETRFLQDLLYGAWQQDALDPKVFTKTVKKRLSSRTLQGYASLTYSVELD